MALFAYRAPDFPTVPLHPQLIVMANARDMAIEFGMPLLGSRFSQETFTEGLARDARRYAARSGYVITEVEPVAEQGLNQQGWAFPDAARHGRPGHYFCSDLPVLASLRPPRQAGS